MSALPLEVLQLAPMRVEDLDDVATAEASLYEFPWSRANFSDSLTAGYSAWVARHRSELVAYAVMMLVVDEAHLLNLSVQKAWQCLGYGKGMLRHLFQLAHAGGATRMFLEVRPSNAAALALYRHTGFSGVGMRRGYYPASGGREDAIVMSAEV